VPRAIAQCQSLGAACAEAGDLLADRGPDAPNLATAQSQPLIAVLDDEDDAAASICQCLSLQHLRALPFTDPADLVAALRTHEVDAFVLDWSLGSSGTSGDLVEWLRANPATADAPIFILTGTMSVSGRPTDRELSAAIELHGLLFRRKPLPCVRLAQDLRAAIRPR
jgi:CheY-like chemotaxis protein